MKHLSLVSLFVISFVYSQCNQNNWQQHSPNLEYCNLENVNIAWEDLSGFNFTGANLINSNLVGSNFSGANLTNAILVEADLTWAVLSFADLTNADLTGSSLGAADFTGANLTGANLYGAICFDTNFSNACIENTYGFPTSGYVGDPILSGCGSSLPDWYINPAEFEYVMSVTARIFNEFGEIGNEYDLLGAFYENQCIGIAEAAEVPPFLGGGYAFLIQVYSNSGQGNSIGFQFYSNEENIVLDIQGTLSFVSDAILGDLMNPVMLYTVGSNDNIPPTTENATYILDEDTSIMIELSATDIDGDSLNFIINSMPEHGTLTVSGSLVHYIPAQNYFGEDSFTFVAYDGQSNSNIATVSLIINGINDPPYLSPIPDATIQFGDVFTYALEAYDVDSENIIYTATSSGEGAIINITDNVLTIMSEEGNVVFNIIVTATDGSLTDSKDFLITVLEQSQTCIDENNDGWCDHFPTIILNQDSVVLLSTNVSAEYQDMGALCYDNEDGDISHVVEVSGEIVNMAIPDMYEINYHCEDSDGNEAQALTRTVVVYSPIVDENQDGFDDTSFIEGALSGDTNLDGILNVADIVMLINAILSNE